MNKNFIKTWIVLFLEEVISSLPSSEALEHSSKSNALSPKRIAHRKTLHQTSIEIKELNDPVNDLVSNLGTELINEIQAEENFPPDYLKNVIEKVTSIKVRYDSAKSKIDKISSEVEFSDYHRNFENQLQILTNILDDCESWLKEFSRNFDPTSHSMSKTDKGNYCHTKFSHYFYLNKS